MLVSEDRRFFIATRFPRLQQQENSPVDSEKHDGAFLLDEGNVTGDSIVPVIESPVSYPGRERPAEAGGRELIHDGG